MPDIVSLFLLIKSKAKQHLSLFCHSGLSGIFPYGKKDSGQAGMTEKKRVQGEFSLMASCFAEQ